MSNDITPLSEAPKKDRVIDALSAEGSALRKYQAFFIGNQRWGALLRFELAAMLAGPMPGALGFALRKVLFPSLFAEIGQAVQFGRNLSIRCPGRMSIGPNVAIDDGCSLDARGAVGPEDFIIGARTLVARDTILLVKQGHLRIGADCSIGSQCNFSAVSGIEIGDHAIIAGQCYFGGGRYKTALNGQPMVSQGLMTKGPVFLGRDVWVGAGVRVLDGARIGDGAIVGAGAVVTGAVEPNAIVAGIPARQIGTRDAVAGSAVDTSSIAALSKQQ
ncbi:MAG: acyltransferase [Pseudomonadota bacterium]